MPPLMNIAQAQKMPPAIFSQCSTTCHDMPHLDCLGSVSLSLASWLLFAQMPTARPQRGQRSGDAMEMHRASVLAVAANQIIYYRLLLYWHKNNTLTWTKSLKTAQIYSNLQMVFWFLLDLFGFSCGLICFNELHVVMLGDSCSKSPIIAEVATRNMP